MDQVDGRMSSPAGEYLGGHDDSRFGKPRPERRRT